MPSARTWLETPKDRPLLTATAIAVDTHNPGQGRLGLTAHAPSTQLDG